jgi:hypothetical protein
MSIVHIVLNGRAACGFTSDRPEKWTYEHKWVYPEEAHHANCWNCIGRLNTLDELETKGSGQPNLDLPWPHR